LGKVSNIHYDIADHTRGLAYGGSAISTVLYLFHANHINEAMELSRANQLSISQDFSVQSLQELS